MPTRRSRPCTTVGGPPSYRRRLANTGPLVPPDQVQRPFEPIQRLHRVSDNAPRGLGLSIVRAIVAAHSAELNAYACPEGGLVLENVGSGRTWCAMASTPSPSRQRPSRRAPERPCRLRDGVRRLRRGGHAGLMGGRWLCRTARTRLRLATGLSSSGLALLGVVAGRRTGPEGDTAVRSSASGPRRRQHDLEPGRDRAHSVAVIVHGWLEPSGAGPSTTTCR